MTFSIFESRSFNPCLGSENHSIDKTAIIIFWSIVWNIAASKSKERVGIQQNLGQIEGGTVIYYVICLHLQLFMKFDFIIII